MMKTMQVLVLVVGVASSVLADAPLPPPRAYEVCSPQKVSCARVDPQAGTTVYQEREDGKRYVQWTMAGWFRDLHVSDDGAYVVTGYDGLNLLPMKFVAPDLVVLTFWHEGEVIRRVRLGEVFPDLSVLEPTISHYNWGGTRGFNHSGLFELWTVDGRVLEYDPETGNVARERRQSGQ